MELRAFVRAGKAGALIPALLATLFLACAGGKDVPVKVRSLPPAPNGLELGYELPEPRYLIGAGDLMHIKYLGEEALDTNVRVTPDGYISVPMVDEPILVTGMAIADLTDYIEEQIGKYIVDPQVYVNLFEMGSQHVFVLGNVTYPHMASSEPLTLAGVIADCQGIEEDGQRKQVIVIRRVPGSEPLIFDIDFSQLLDGKSLAPDIPLQRYDIVIVPKSRVAKLRDWMNAVFSNNLPVTRFGINALLLHRAIKEDMDLYYQN